MAVLKGILRESWGYYKKVEAELIKRLGGLPKGAIKRRKINKRIYYYLQFRRGAKVVHKYLGKRKPVEINKKLRERIHLERELKKVRISLKMLSRVKRRKRKK